MAVKEIFNILLFAGNFWAIDLSLIIALIALFYSIREIKRTNDIIIKIKECSSGLQHAIDENNGQPFSFLKITVQNNGINLYSPKMCLTFTHEKGGTFNAPLKQEILSDFPVETFSKGMIATFYFKTYELDKGNLHFLSLLRNPQKQNACLCLYSQTYLAKTFSVNSLSDRIKKLWNRLSWKLSFKRKKGTNWENKDIVKYYQLPTFQTYGDKIDYFIQVICQQDEIRKNGEGR